MRWVRGFVILLASVQAGFMVFDGLHALILGDYFTPKSGPFRGRLGPWSMVVESVGIPARSLPMKMIFVAYGSIWLAIVVRYARGWRWGRAAMILAAVGSLWCVGPGTPLAITQLLLLILLPPNRPTEVPA